MKDKAVMLSVYSHYAELLVDGVKTIELRKVFPLDLPVDSEIYIYASRGDKKVIGRVKVKSIKRLMIGELWAHAAVEAMIPWYDFKRYYSGKDYGYAIEVYRQLRFPEPKELSDFGVKRAPQSYQFIEVSNGSI